MDKLEQMDIDTLHEFGAWLEDRGLTSDSNKGQHRGTECSIIIEDGYVRGEDTQPATTTKNNKKLERRGGEF